MSVPRFVAGLLALHLALSVAYVRLVGMDHEVIERDGWYLHRDPSVHIVVAGDSHPRLDVYPDLLPGSVSIASRGEDYLKNRYRLPWLLDQDSEGIDTVILGYDAVAFSGTRVESFKPEWVWGRYVPFLELGWRLGSIRPFAGKWAKAHLAPYAGEAETLSQWVGNRRSFRGPEDGKRLVPVQFQWGDEVAERHFPGGSAWHPALETALRELLADLKGRGIRVVLVSFPVTAEYADAVEKRGADKARRERLLQELLEPGVVDHLDYGSLGWGNRKLFGDADHLSPMGAKLFTVKLRKDLAAMGIGEAVD